MRKVLAQNVANLMQYSYSTLGNKPKALAADANVSLSTIQRLLAEETGATIDNIESIAGAFGLSAYQLLLPALNPKNPQVVRGATKEEERLYRQWKSIRLNMDEREDGSST